ncbi:hypothetical protein ECG_07798 [Echinococcus granulosus]|nr:hypothetical protein ECG_07798 [Echinococcus granulosus]
MLSGAVLRRQAQDHANGGLANNQIHRKNARGKVATTKTREASPRQSQVENHTNGSRASNQIHRRNLARSAPNNNLSKRRVVVEAVSTLSNLPRESEQQQESPKKSSPSKCLQQQPTSKQNPSYCECDSRHESTQSTKPTSQLNPRDTLKRIRCLKQSKPSLRREAPRQSIDPLQIPAFAYNDTICSNQSEQSCRAQMDAQLGRESEVKVG